MIDRLRYNDFCKPCFGYVAFLYNVAQASVNAFVFVVTLLIKNAQTNAFTQPSMALPPTTPQSNPKTPLPPNAKQAMVRAISPRSTTSPAQKLTPPDPFSEEDKLSNIAGSDDMRMSSSPPASDRRMSKEWDASKVPPSRFQRREGSIYSTPNSRDGHVKGSSRDKAYFEKLKEKV